MAVIVNPRSHGNKGGGARLETLLRQRPEIAWAAPADQAGLEAALRRFAGERAGLLAISGGDGTVRDVLSALPEAYPDGLPHLAILSAGNTNLAARALGSPGHGAKALARLLAAAQADTLRCRQCRYLQVSWPSQAERRPVRGFFLGAAAFADGKRFADAHIYKRGVHQGLAVGLAVGAAALRALFAGAEQAAGTPMEVGLDGAPPRPGPRRLLLATTLDRLLFGLWPFWGEGDGAVHVLDVDVGQRRLATALLAVLRQRPKPWMAAAGYRSARAETVRIRLRQPFVFDGEWFDPGPDGILLSAPGCVTVASA